MYEDIIHTGSGDIEYEFSDALMNRYVESISLNGDNYHQIEQIQ